MINSLRGTGVLQDSDKQLDVDLTVNLEEGVLLARYADPDVSLPDLFQRLAERDNGVAETVALHDVNIVTPERVLRAARLDNLLVRGRLSSSVDALLIDGPRLVTMTLVPSRSLLTFECDPPISAHNEVAFNGNTVVHGRRVFSLGVLDVEVSGEPPNWRVRSSKPLWEHQRRITLAASLLLGVRAQPLWGTELGLMRLNLAKASDYQKAHRLYRDDSVAWPLFEALLRFTFGLTDSEFAKWYKAVAFLLEGKSSHSELDIRTVNLFVFLEMFDGSDTLDAGTLAGMLEISRSDAELIKRTRNRLIHQPDSLSEALLAVDRELRTWDAKYSLRWFSVGGRPHDAAVMFSLRLYERINHFIVRQTGSTIPHYAYEETIGPQR